MATSSSSTSSPASSNKMILVLGSCGLDRLLTVSTYPAPDAKVRTTNYVEVGGGNAANTASAMALLSNAKFLQPCRNTDELQEERQSPSVAIKLCTKIGDDPVGRVVMDELMEAGVDLSSPLFKVGQGRRSRPDDRDERGSSLVTLTTTGFTTVIVSEQEKTRACIHTPGTCGELEPEDVLNNNNNLLDQVFADPVVHFHSDARHTDVALLIAKEARKRGIPVSLDVEKDRNTPALDELLEQATMIFTNADQIDAYLTRLNKEYEEKRDGARILLQCDPQLIVHDETTSSSRSQHLNSASTALFARAIRPSRFFTRWYRQTGKEIIITQGSRGVLHVKCHSIHSTQQPPKRQDDEHDVDVESDTIRIRYDDASQSIRVTDTFFVKADCNQQQQLFDEKVVAEYTIRTCGVLADVNVVDTTGAGDAFAGGYILGTMVGKEAGGLEYGEPYAKMDEDFIVRSALRLGCWVAGNKLQGPGARTALPRATDINNLGTNYPQIQENLKQLITEFR